MLKDFKAFIARGNVLDLAVAFILGAAFTTIVRSLVDDIIMPPIGLLLGNVDFTNLFVTLEGGNPAGPYATLADAEAAGAVTINYGVFINALVAFFILALVLFLTVRWVLRFVRREQVAAEAPAPATKDCPYCFSTIALAATRCPACTSELSTLAGSSGVSAAT